MESRHTSEEYQEIIQELIDTEPCLEYIRDSSVTIVALGSDQERKANGKTVFGECEKIQAKYKWCVPCDFTITVFEPNTERFTDDQLRILLLHELMHVGIERDGNEEKYRIIPHDVEEFRAIIERYGVNWADDET